VASSRRKLWRLEATNTVFLFPTFLSGTAQDQGHNFVAERRKPSGDAIDKNG